MTADELFDKGIVFLKDNNTLGALACFEKAFEMKKAPEIQSYLAYCIALERGQITHAVYLCEAAITEDPANSVHYLNLSRILLKAKRKTDALEVLRKGISVADHPEILKLLETIGTRKRPVFRFFRRENLLNKYTGLLLSRLKLR